jgi:hypothetical protein
LSERKRIETRELDFECVPGGLVADIASDIVHLHALGGRGDVEFRAGDPLTESGDEKTVMFFAVQHFCSLFKKIEM